MPDQDQLVRTTRTFKLTLAYDGTDFSGWQIQPGKLTIQGELQAALGRITGESPLPQGSGRTDAGVHALAQVASFSLNANIPPENLLRALNRTLPPSIRILTSSTMPGTFHARHSAIAKTYEYRVFCEAICPPFLARYVHMCPWSMDVEALQSSARLFQGRHNFLSFAATDPDLTSRTPESNKSLPAAEKRIRAVGRGFIPGVSQIEAIRALAPEVCASNLEPDNQPSPADLAAADSLLLSPTAIRTIYSSTWHEQKSESGNLLIYRVRGSGFLHHMVRNLVGTMLDIGRNRLSVDEIPKILAACSRSAAGPTAPAQGLFLHSVEYGDADSGTQTE
jgi:tRNA pseudouridine38-40 synthase